MARDFGVDSESYDREELVIRENPDSIPITLNDGYGTLPRGQALGRETANGYYSPWDADAVDGTATCTGFLVDEVDTSSEEPAAMYVQGVFNQDAIEWDNDTTGIDNDAADIAAEILLLQARGIIVKRPDRAVDAVDIPE